MFKRGQFLALWLIIWKRQLGSISSSDPDRAYTTARTCFLPFFNFICSHEGSFFLYFTNIRIFLAIDNFVSIFITMRVNVLSFINVPSFIKFERVFLESSLISFAILFCQSFFSIVSSKLKVR